MQQSVILTALLAIVLLVTISLVTAGSHRCNKPDCTDVIGEGLVKENLGRAQHFTEKHHDEMEEAHRKQRIELANRGEINHRDL